MGYEDAQLELERTFRLMDVADEIRRQHRRISAHLENSDRERIKSELLERYRGMGHQADPALIDEAIGIVLAQRYRFQAPAAGFRLRLARLYVLRGRIARRVGIPAALLAALILIITVSGRVADRARNAEAAEVAEALQRVYTQVRELAEDPAALAEAERLHEQGTSLLTSGKAREADERVDELSELREVLDQEYQLVILRGRERDDRRHYLIVQALDHRSNPLPVRIRNEETQEIEEVTEWGERVDRNLYERIAADYGEDNVIDDRIFGEKRRGYLEADRRYPDRGQITRY